MNIFSSLKNILNHQGLIVLLSLSIMGCGESHSIQTTANQPINSIALSKKQNFSQHPTSVQDKVNLYLQLLQTDQYPASAYVDFITNNPTWPNQQVLLNLMQKALLNETDKQTIISICQNQPIRLASALTFCAQQTSIDASLLEKAKHAWIYSISLPQDEQEIISTFGKSFTSQDQWNRFDRLEKAGLTIAAARQINYLTPSQQTLAQARLAFRKKQLDAESLLNSLNKSQLQDVGLIYNRLRWLRLQDRQDEALKLWQDKGLEAEQNSKEKRFWTERQSLIRDFISTNHIKSAYALITNSICTTSTCQQDEAFLGGWINLRKLNNPSKSIGYFKKLTTGNAVITKSRGYYWLGRSYIAMHHELEARQAWQQAAHFPTTFYGQLAIASLQTHTQNILLHPELIRKNIQSALKEIKEPFLTTNQINSFKNNELIQAAHILVEQNDYTHARPFMLAYNKLYSDITNQRINAHISNEFNLPEDAVAVSRNAGNKGIILLKNGWPRPYSELNISSLPSGLTLGIMRQESSFNPTIVSHAHAYGLMQLLPSTARELCRQNNIATRMGNPGNLIVPENNIRLGAAYLTKLMKRFNNNLIYVIASYNAGPNRVNQWINNNLNPIPLDNIDETIDWIEMIPFTETRNYVQHVMENMIIYQTDINK